MARRTEHSKLGRWSLRLSLLFGVAFLLGLAGLRFMQSVGYVEDTGTPPQFAILVVLVMLLCLLIVLVALVLGIAGMLQRRHKKQYAVLGAFVSVLVLGVAYYAWLGPFLASRGYTFPLT
jgi:cytochrome bd-type quinol oxidase subunit 2